MNRKIIEQLKEYFERKPDVLLAFLFGSVAKSRETEDSDVDIAIYGLEEGQGQRNRICQDLESLVGRGIDLIRFQEAPATLVSSIFKTGIPLTIKDKNLYWKFYLAKTMEAEDFSEFAKSYWDISQRSLSLNPEDKTRLLERLRFLENELADIERFEGFTLQEYREERTKRREIERWAENIMNAMIDIAKIVLASEKKDMPKTYELALRDFALYAGVGEEGSLKFSKFAEFRNLLAHEYLDILYERINNFIEEFPSLYRQVSKFLTTYTEK